MTFKDITIGDQVKYNLRGSRSIEKSGRVIDKTGHMIVVDLGRYRDTFTINDLVSGEVTILSVCKGEEIMSNRRKLQMPAPSELAAIFERAGQNITKAAAIVDPPVSDVTMGRWLRLAGIIPQAEKTAGDNPDQDKQKPVESKQNKIETPAETNKQQAQAQEEVQDHDTIKKLVDFAVAPLHGKIAKLELSVASLAGIVLESGKNNGHPSYLAALDVIADLVIRIAGRIQNGGPEFTTAGRPVSVRDRT